MNFEQQDISKRAAEGDVRRLSAVLAIHDDANVRHQAAEALGRIGESAIEPLVAALADPHAYVRTGATNALERIGEPAVEPLIAVLTHHDQNVRWEATYTLGRIGDSRGVEPLVTNLTHPDPTTREAAADALGKLGDPRAVDPLVTLLTDPDSGMQRAAAFALRRIGEPAVEPLIATLTVQRLERGTQEDLHLRKDVAWALGEIGDRRAIEALIPNLSYPWTQVRQETAEALAKIGAPEALEPLIAAIHGRTQTTAEGSAIGRALIRIGAPAVEPLIALLNDSNVSARVTAVWVLGEIADPRAVGPLQATELGDPDLGVRRTATAALSKL